MNRYPSIILKIIFIVMMFFFVFVVRYKYTNASIREYSELSKPVTLYYKEKLTFLYSVILKDSKGKLIHFTNISKFANKIGENYNIGDTLMVIIDRNNYEFKIINSRDKSKNF